MFSCRPIRTLIFGMGMREDVASTRDDARRLRVNGELWLVYEVVPTYDRRGPSLVFECERLVRRVRNYAANWRDLSDSDLAILMEQV